MVQEERERERESTHAHLPWPIVALLVAARRRGDEETTDGVGAGSEAHITPNDEDEEDHEDPRIIDEKVPQGGQENPIHASTEYVNGRTDIKETKKNEKTDTPV